jgi:hypothetical protein
MIRSLSLVLIALVSTAAAPRTANLMRDAFTPQIALIAGKVVTLTGESDHEVVRAEICLSATQSSISSITLSQDGEKPGLPESAYATMKGAKFAWLEERGKLTTLVVEGADAGKDWRLALLFHPHQLWERRLSREGVGRDNFTFYDRKDMTPSKPQHRHTINRGFHE